MPNNKSNNTGCLGFLFASFLGRNSKQAIEYPYGTRDHFLSAAEISFFHVLKSILPPEYYVITKVRLLDIFFVRQPHKNQAARNRIDRKHVDFLICRADTMDPVFAIELDDKSHQRKDRQERDAFVDKAFQAANLPLIHIQAAKGYRLESIREKMAPYLQ